MFCQQRGSNSKLKDDESSELDMTVCSQTDADNVLSRFENIVIHNPQVPINLVYEILKIVQSHSCFSELPKD